MLKTTFFPFKLFKKQHLVKALKFKDALLVFLCISVNMLMISCDGDAHKFSKEEVQKQTKSKQIIGKSKSQIQPVDQKELKSDTNIEVLAEKEILYNGQLKRYSSFKEFQSVLGKPDSTKLLIDEEPCTNIFQEPDGSIDPEAKYLYKNGSRFEYSKDKVAIDEINFSLGNFIIFHKQKLNKHTTLVTLKKLFPIATAHIGVMDVAGEGALQVIQLREDKDNISDGHINIFLKNGRLYLLHWWFPC